jgi:hypothetical protein
MTKNAHPGTGIVEERMSCSGDNFGKPPALLEATTSTVDSEPKNGALAFARDADSVEAHCPVEID